MGMRLLSTHTWRSRAVIAGRVMCALVLAAGMSLASPHTARAAGVEYLMVPSAAMGRDIPVAFQGGGPHAVFLLDAFDAAPDVSNWVTAGNAMNTLAGKGISVAAPAGGAYSMYTNWEQDGSRQWDTFLSAGAARLARRQQGSGPGRARCRRGRAGRLRRHGTGDVPSGPVPLRRLAVRLPHPGTNRRRRRDHRGSRSVRRRRHPQHVGTASARALEVARPRRPRRPAGRQQHPAVGLQPGLDWTARTRPR